MAIIRDPAECATGTGVPQAVVRADEVALPATDGYSVAGQDVNDGADAVHQRAVGRLLRGTMLGRSESSTEIVNEAGNGAVVGVVRT